MENKNTNIDILELLNKENSNENNEYLSLLHEENHINDTIDVLSNLKLFENQWIENMNNNIIFSNERNEKFHIFTNIWNGFLFLFKYISTSTLIFLFLLSVTNYSAYIEIARSYLNPEVLEQNKMNLLSSVQWTNISVESPILIDTFTKISVSEKVNMVKNKTYHSMDKLLTSNYDENLNMNIEIVPYENRILIPKIGKNIPLIDVKSKMVENVKELEDVFMEELSNGVIRYPWSAKPWELWNSFIFWHSSNFPWIKWEYNDVFALLDTIVFWDEIIAYYNQKKYVYKIKEKKIIKPGDVSVLKRNTNKKEISLMTCWPIGTTLNRMIVIGELIE